MPTADITALIIRHCVPYKVREPTWHSEFALALFPQIRGSKATFFIKKSKNQKKAT